MPDSASIESSSVEVMMDSSKVPIPADEFTSAISGTAAKRRSMGGDDAGHGGGGCSTRGYA